MISSRQPFGNPGISGGGAGVCLCSLMPPTLQPTGAPFNPITGPARQVAVLLGASARVLIEPLPGPCDPDAFLFPRHAEGRGIWILTNCWRTACANAKPGSLRLHDLRHTAASQAVMAGENLPLVGKLLGHRRHRTTAGYAHLADGRLVDAAEKVDSTIAEAMQFDKSWQALIANPLNRRCR